MNREYAMDCPRCGESLENPSKAEGGWCPKCEAWYPSDLIEDEEEYMRA